VEGKVPAGAGEAAAAEVGVVGAVVRQGGAALSEAEVVRMQGEDRGRQPRPTTCNRRSAGQLLSSIARSGTDCPRRCGVMPSRNHAKALVDQLRRAESALHDLFYEATDDGIEALEAVLAACRDEVLTRMPVEGGATGEELRRERERIQSELDGKVQQRRAV